MLAAAIDWNAGFADFLPNHGDTILAKNGRNKGLIIFGIICAWIATALWVCLVFTVVLLSPSFSEGVIHEAPRL